MEIIDKTSLRERAR